MNILLQLSSQEYAIMWNPRGKWISNFHLSNRVEQTKMQKSYNSSFFNRHHITEILLKMVLHTITLTFQLVTLTFQLVTYFMFQIHSFGNYIGGVMVSFGNYIGCVMVSVLAARIG
jgi:hypothetical protein